MEKQPTETRSGLKDMNTAYEDKPPLLSNWNQLYALVLLNLIVLIVLFYIFTKTFS